jgi:cytidine deaminase
MGSSQARGSAEPIPDAPWEALSTAAWRVRDRARVYGPTRVGAAVLSNSGQVHIGCNVEHRFRSHDVHAEVAALSAMVAAGDNAARALLVAAERERFTPCGSCLDWIFELGGPSCLVAFQPTPRDQIAALPARELMPHYPR